MVSSPGALTLHWYQVDLSNDFVRKHEQGIFSTLLSINLMPYLKIDSLFRLKTHHKLISRAVLGWIGKIR